MNGYALRDSEKNRWWINRDGGIDVSGEWEPSTSWKGTRKLFPKVETVIRIYGRYKSGSFGLRPRSWSGDLVINWKHYPIPTTHSSCKSIPDAIKYAERGLTDDFIIKCFTDFYQQKHALCISRMATYKDEPITGPIPYLTTFWHQDWMELPCYTYVYSEPSPWRDETVRFGSIKRFHLGYAGRSHNKEVPQWIDYERVFTKRT